MIAEAEETENLIERMEIFARKMKTAEMLLCDSHQLEYADFESCPACEREEREKEMKETKAGTR